MIKIWGLGIGDWGLGPIPNPHYINKLTNRKQKIIILLFISLFILKSK